MLIQAKKKGSAVVILSDLLAALASQNCELLLLGAQKEPSRKPLGASYTNKETPAPAKAWTKARTKAQAKTAKARYMSPVNAPVNTLVNIVYLPDRQCYSTVYLSKTALAFATQPL